MNTHTYMLMRRERGNIDAAAQVELTTDDPNEDNAWHTFQALVTKWVQDTTKGLRVWMDSVEDLNIGDLLNDGCEADLKQMLPFSGIADIRLLSLNGAQERLYDELLVDPSQISWPAAGPVFQPSTLSRSQKLDLIAEQLSYGLSWLEDSESRSARNRGVDTLAHQAACSLFQWFAPPHAVGTSETADALDLYALPDRRAIRRALERYLEEIMEP